MFKAFKLYPVSDPIVSKAIELKQTKKLTLGDSLIAATALVHNLTLVTKNTKDYKWIPQLSVIDPVKS